MTALQLEELKRRVANGEAVEWILASMGLNSNAATDFLKKHPSAKGEIRAAKELAKQRTVSKVETA